MFVVHLSSTQLVLRKEKRNKDSDGTLLINGLVVNREPNEFRKSTEIPYAMGELYPEPFAFPAIEDR